MSWCKDLKKMHAKFGFHEEVKKMSPQLLKELLVFRSKALQEELTEHQKAIEAKDADGVVDSLIDLCVFAIGTLDLFEVNGEKAWNRVRVANMNKEKGIKEGRPNPFGLPDLIKPEGWTAPSHEDNLGRIPEALES